MAGTYIEDMEAMIDPSVYNSLRKRRKGGNRIVGVEWYDDPLVAEPLGNGVHVVDAAQALLYYLGIHKTTTAGAYVPSPPFFKRRNGAYVEVDPPEEMPRAPRIVVFVDGALFIKLPRRYMGYNVVTRDIRHIADGNHV